MSSRQRFSLGLLFCLSFAVYAWTAARTVTLVDSGELILAAAQLGVAHPPGFPLYTIFGHLFSLLPIGSVAFRLSLMSGFFASWAAVFAALASHELLLFQRTASDRAASGKASKSGKSKKASKATKVGKAKKGVKAAESTRDGVEGTAGTTLDEWIPAVVGALLAFSLTLWFYATVAEVYSLNLALLAACWWLLLRWRRAQRDEPERSLRYLLWASACYGLGLAVHHVTVGLMAPAIAVLLVRTAGWRIFACRTTLQCAAAVFAGVSVYAYLPWAAGREPLFNWGDPATLERLWWHLSGKQYQVYFGGTGDAVAENLAMFFDLLMQQATPLGVVMFAAGCWLLLRRDRSFLWCVVAVALFGVGYAVQYDIAEDGDAYFLPTFLMLFIASGPALQWALGWLRGRFGVIAAATAGVVFALSGVLVHWQNNDRHDYQVARFYTEDVLAPIGPRGLVMTRDWQLYAPFLYYHHLEGLRPDVVVVDINLVRRSWYLSYLDTTYPEMMSSLDGPRRSYEVQLVRFENDEAYDAAAIQQRFIALLDGMIGYHMSRGRDVHQTLPAEPGVGQKWTWIPQGLGFRLYATPPMTLPPQPELHLEHFAELPMDPVAETKVRPLYAMMLGHRADYEARGGDLTAAQKFLTAGLELDPESAELQQRLRDIEAQLGQP